MRKVAPILRKKEERGVCERVGPSYEEEPNVHLLNTAVKNEGDVMEDLFPGRRGRVAWKG